MANATIPNSVSHIGGGAFFKCSSLSSVTIPDSVTHIEELAFAYCSSLRSVKMSNSVTHIECHAFASCSSLSGVTFPNAITCIRNSAFENCQFQTAWRGIYIYIYINTLGQLAVTFHMQTQGIRFTSECSCACCLLDQCSVFRGLTCFMV